MHAFFAPPFDPAVFDTRPLPGQAFAATKQLLAGLIELALPERTVRLCDGGFVYFRGEKFTSSDAVFGSLETVEGFEEASGDEAADGRLTLLPAQAATPAQLRRAEHQGAPVRIWLARVDEASGRALENRAELVADMAVDTTALRLGRSSRSLDVTLMPAAERLFAVNEGNTLSSAFHGSVWPGEKGFDNATGVTTTDAWGAAVPARGVKNEPRR